MEITLPDQIKLYFDKAGLGNPTFIFIHGGGADTSHLAPQFYFFGRRGTAINLDLRGYGKSDKPTKYGTIAQYADDVAYLCRQLEITSPIIIGHSMGGMVAVELAAKHPMLPAAIVLISSGVLFPKAALEDEEKVLRGLRSVTYRAAVQALVDQICLPSDRFNLTSKIPFLQFLKSNGWRILKRCLLGTKSRPSGLQLANYLFCTLKTAAAATATCLAFLAFVRSSLSAKQWARVTSRRWKYQSKSTA
jgi:pimeloyl-ACP methyl ester carboxylesterase